MSYTVAHVTHEAIQKIGGIGAVLQGMLTSKKYLEQASRNILIGPFWPGDQTGDQRLGPQGEVLYSSMDSLSRSPLASHFREIEQNFGVGVIYGRRKFVDKETGSVSTPEVLLIDVSRYNMNRLGEFKYRIWKTFGIDSGKYEHIWDYEQYMRLAQPAIACLYALGIGNQLEPAIVLSHEYMGMPTVMAAIMEGNGRFRTIFHAHECATMRRLVEGKPGHDTMFYNVMNVAMAQGHYVDDVFGDQSDYYKHALIRSARFCDNIFAVGDKTLQEIRFLGPEFASVDAQLAYNGVPCWKISVDEKCAAAICCASTLKICSDFNRITSSRTLRAWFLPRECGAICAFWSTWKRCCANVMKLRFCSPSARKCPRASRRYFEHGKVLSLAGGAPRRPARSVQRRNALLPGRSGIQRPLAQYQGGFRQPVRLAAATMRSAHACGNGIHGHS